MNTRPWTNRRAESRIGTTALAIGISLCFAAGSAEAIRAPMPVKEAPRYLVLDSGKSGYIDHTGAVAIPIQFDQARFFSEGRAAVRAKDRKWGFIDAAGNMVIAATYDYVLPFEGGYAIVETNKKWGVIDKRGRSIVPLRYERIMAISESMVSFQEGGKSGLMDLTGKILIAPTFDHLSPPQDGWCIVKQDGRYMFVDTTGKVVFDPVKIGNIAWQFSEGVTPIRMLVGKGKRKKKRWGYINKKGKIEIKPTFVRAHRFSEGMATVETDPKMGFKWGYIDRKGKLVVRPTWHHTDEFSEGRAIVKVGTKFGFIDKTGKVVIPAIYDQVMDFKDGLAWVEFHSCDDRYKGSDGVCQERRRDRVGYIDLSGKMVWKPTPKRAGH